MSETEPTQRKRLRAIINTPVFGLVAGIVVTIGVGWYFYHKTGDRPELDWSVSTQIEFDYRNATTDVTMLDAHGTKITDSVYASQITVWNAGNIGFDDVDNHSLIREPLTFRLTGSGRIVSASIANRKNDTAGEWAMQNGQNDATMTWKHFDRNAAVRVLILYAGDGASVVKPTIVVAGVDVLRNVVPSSASTLSFVQALRTSVIIGVIYVVLISWAIFPDVGGRFRRTVRTVVMIAGLFLGYFMGDMFIGNLPTFGP